MAARCRGLGEELQDQAGELVGSAPGDDVVRILDHGRARAGDPADEQLADGADLGNVLRR